MKIKRNLARRVSFCWMHMSTRRIDKIFFAWPGILKISGITSRWVANFFIIFAYHTETWGWNNISSKASDTHLHEVRHKCRDWIGLFSLNVTNRTSSWALHRPSVGIQVIVHILEGLPNHSEPNSRSVSKPISFTCAALWLDSKWSFPFRQQRIRTAKLNSAGLSPWLACIRWAIQFYGGGYWIVTSNARLNNLWLMQIIWVP